MAKYELEIKEIEKTEAKTPDNPVAGFFISVGVLLFILAMV